MHWNMIFICWGFRGKKSTAKSNWNGSPCTGMHLQKNRIGAVVFVVVVAVGKRLLLVVLSPNQIKSAAKAIF